MQEENCFYAFLGQLRGIDRTKHTCRPGIAHHMFDEVETQTSLAWAAEAISHDYRPENSLYLA